MPKVKGRRSPLKAGDTTWAETVIGEDDFTLTRFIENDNTFRNAVKKAVDTLPDTQRECFLMYYFWEELGHSEQPKYREIAQKLNIAEGTVKSHLFNAKKAVSDNSDVRTAFEESNGYVPPISKGKCY